MDHFADTSILPSSNPSDTAPTPGVEGPLGFSMSISGSYEFYGDGSAGFFQGGSIGYSFILHYDATGDGIADSGADVLMQAWLSLDGQLGSDDHRLSSWITILDKGSSGTYGSHGSFRLPLQLVTGDYHIIYTASVTDGVTDGSAVTDISWYGGDHGMDAIYLEGIQPDWARTKTLFKEAGNKTAFLADLALAAYHLDRANGHEVLSGNKGKLNSHAENAFEALPDGFHLLDEADISDLQLETGSWPQHFPLDGLANGIFTEVNSAALVGRSKDALFVSFRGTNGKGDAIPDWITMKNHWNNFDDLISALRSYIKANTEISKLYLSGHSLGGAMVEAFTREYGTKFAGVKVEAVTFASPGFKGSGLARTETELANFRIEFDPVPLVNDIEKLGHNTSGDITIIRHDIPNKWLSLIGADLHGMKLYNDVAEFLAQEGVDTTSRIGSLINYSDIHIAVDTINKDLILYEIGTLADTIKGSDSSEIIVGGGNNDILRGKGGHDWLLGGADQDVIYGGDGMDEIEGGDQADTLYGQIGVDVIKGGAGRDMVYGGKGGDVLYGGGDRDTFVLQTKKDSKAGLSDIILDWDKGGKRDWIDLSQIDAESGKILHAGDQAFRFIGDFDFSGVKGELRFEIIDGQTWVEGDMNGDGDADIRLGLTGAHSMTYDDFIL